MPKSSKPPLLFAVVAPGLEEVALAEARAKGFRSLKAVRGGFELRGSPLRANRALGIPTRILMPITEYRARHFEQLLEGAKAVKWKRFGGLTPKATAHRSRLFHTGAVEGRLREILPEGPGTLHVKLDNDVCTLSIDTTGELLHRRGWRENPAAAPLRETLASGLLGLADWKAGEALYDPMCGSGTFLIEAAVAAAGRAPGGNRTFDCEAWWRTELPVTFDAVPTVIAGSDLNGMAVAAATANAERAGVELDVKCHAAIVSTPPAETGLLICNPPYGKRTKRPAEAFDQLGTLLEGAFKNWRAAIICPAPELAGRLRRTPTKNLLITNGGLKLRFLVFEPVTP